MNGLVTQEDREEYQELGRRFAAAFVSYQLHESIACAYDQYGKEKDVSDYWIFLAKSVFECLKNRPSLFIADEI